MADEPWVGLAEVIDAVRAELLAARSAGVVARVRFVLEPVELELVVQVRRAATADGEVRIGVVAGGAGGERSSASTHRLVVRLAPPDGRGAPAGDRRPGVR